MSFPTRREVAAVTICLGFVLGEYVASCMPWLAELWIGAAVLSAIVLFVGYGFSLRFWPVVFAAFLGVALYFHASVDQDRQFRHQPWLRASLRRAHRDADQSLLGTGLVEAKADFSEHIAIGLEEESDVVALNRAILLGERARLPWKTKRMFIESGTIHVFAISGLHIMAIAQVFVLLMRFLLIPRRFAGLVSLPFLWGYVLMVGAPPSAVRAVIMASFYFGAALFCRRPNAIFSWTAAFLLSYGLNPLWVENVGCGLSFSVMLGIILAARLGFPISLAAWLSGLPLALAAFGRFTPGGLLANVFLIPAAAVTVVAGFLGMLFGFVSETLAAHLNNLAALFTEAMVFISTIVASFPWSNFEIYGFGPLQAVELYCLFILLLVWRRIRQDSVLI